MSTRAVATIEPAANLPTTEVRPNVARDDVAAVLAAWLTAKATTTRRAYLADLDAFANVAGTPDHLDALAALWSCTPARADDAMSAYVTSMTTTTDERPRLAPATVARRVATLRSVTRRAAARGLTALDLNTETETVTPYRDTEGPGLDNLAAMIATTDPTTAKGARDRALLMLMGTLALRRAEVCALDLDDYDTHRRRLAVTGKGKRETLPLTLPAETADALDGWVAHRGNHPGALFAGLRGRQAGRLNGGSVARIVAAAAKAANVTGTVRPHGLRHTAITAALDVANGDVRAAAKFSRHAKLETVMVYDDNRADLGGQLAATIARRVVA